MSDYKGADAGTFLPLYRDSALREVSIEHGGDVSVQGRAGHPAQLTRDDVVTDESDGGQACPSRFADLVFGPGPVNLTFVVPPDTSVTIQRLPSNRVPPFPCAGRWVALPPSTD